MGCSLSIEKPIVHCRTQRKNVFKFSREASFKPFSQATQRIGENKTQVLQNLTPLSLTLNSARRDTV